MAFRWWADGGPLCLLDRFSFSYTGTDPCLSLCKGSWWYNKVVETLHFEPHLRNWIRVLTLNAPIAIKVVCFSHLLKYLRSLNCKQCGSRSGAVCSGSTLIASRLNSSVMLGNYLQQTTSADDIFRCIFFPGALRVNLLETTQSAPSLFMGQGLLFPSYRYFELKGYSAIFYSYCKDLFWMIRS